MSNDCRTRNLFGLLAAAALSSGAPNLTATDLSDWKANTISPVTNPLFFESPQIDSEVRPLFIWHNLDKQLGTSGGDVEVYAVQLRYAVTDRLAIIATKDGYIDFNPKTGLPHQSGWADIAAGLKYALIDDTQHNFILTPGVKFEIPIGNTSVFQGSGSGEWDAFVSAAKGWGNFHATASIGFRLPNDWDKKTAQAHYSGQLDYYLCQYFIPFVSANAFTVLSNGKGLPLNFEGFDLINFGASKASGQTMTAIGGGVRSRLIEKLDLGVGYEVGVGNPKGLFDDRFTVDLIYRF